MKDFNIKTGIEFETGIDKVLCVLAKRYSDECANVYSYGYDSGGVELRTTVLENPTLFKTIGRFGSLTNQIRTTYNFRPKDCIGTHIHITGNNISDPDLNMKVSHNFFVLLNKYTLAFGFLDTFLRGNRRNTYYGHPFYPEDGTILFRDKRNYESDNIPYNYLKGLGRESLIRTSLNSTNNIHFEYRGGDGCFSPIFMGLRLELLKALLKLAAIKTNKVGILNPEIGKFKDKLNLINIKYPHDITDCVCREAAYKMINELKSILPEYAYRGLIAWINYVDILAVDTGMPDWYTKYEKTIINEIGVDSFISKIELDAYCAKATNKVYTLREDVDAPALFRAKFKKYGTILGIGDNIADVRSQSVFNKRKAYINACSHCYEKKVALKDCGGFFVCYPCYNLITKSKRLNKPNVKKLPNIENDIPISFE